jgi:hypothetical protein
LRPDLIHRPGVGTSLREAGVMTRPKALGFSFALSSVPLFDRDRGYFFVLTWTCGALRTGTVKNGPLPPKACS